MHHPSCPARTGTGPCKGCPQTPKRQLPNPTPKTTPKVTPRPKKNPKSK